MKCKHNYATTQRELSIESLEEDENVGLIIFGENFIVSLSCRGANFESWVKLLGPPLSTSQTLRKCWDLEKSMHMGPEDTLESQILIARHHSLCMVS
jgi:hypothetical protein